MSHTERASRCSRGTGCWRRRFGSCSPTRRPSPARELVDATLGMIGGQYLDITGADVDLDGAPPTQDGTVVRRVGRSRPLGGRGARGGAGALAGVRRGARVAVPDRRRRPRRRRLCSAARRSPRARGLAARGGGASPRRSGRDRRRTPRRCSPSSTGSRSAPPSGACGRSTGSRRAGAPHGEPLSPSRAMPPAGSSSTGICSIDQPAAARTVEECCSVPAPGSAINASPPAATAACKQVEERQRVALLVEDVRSDDEIETASVPARRAPSQSSTAAVTARPVGGARSPRRARRLPAPSPSPAPTPPRPERRRTTGPPARTPARARLCP